MKYIIYKLIFPNGKIYIGQTKQVLKNRMAYHKYAAYNKNSHNYDNLVYRAIRKYGWNVIDKQTLIICNENFVDYYERRLIDFYKTNNRSFGYNIESGGNKYKNISAETRKKIREKKLGTKQSVEQVAKKSKSVACYTQNGQLIKIYSSSHEAARLDGYCRSSINRCANELKKYSTHHGLVWKYYESK